MDGILEKSPFIQVKMMDVTENGVDLNFLEQSEAVIFGSPVYFTGMSWELKKWFDQSFRTGMSWELKKWFDQSFRTNLKGKLGTVFVTANSFSGGTDTRSWISYVICW